MSDQEFSPRAARHLRGFGRRRVDDVEDERAPGETPDDEVTSDQGAAVAEAPDTGSTERSDGPAERSDGPAPTEPTTPLAPGSIWGPQLTATEPAKASPASPPPPPPPSGGDAQSPEATAAPSVNPKHRRRAGEGPPDPEAVEIASDDSHAWWAQRDELDRLVNPKKRGAAARAQRAAREAFAPAGATNVAANAYAQNEAHQYSWDPASVYTWASEGEPVDEETVPARREATPWDVLGLTSEASWEEVLRQHRRLAKQHHPDRHAADDGASRTEAEQRMAEINAAFGDLRRIYRLTDGI